MIDRSIHVSNNALLTPKMTIFPCLCSAAPKSSTMQGVFDNVRKTAVKTKIRGEIALLDRQIHQMQCKFGVEYYDAVYSFGQQHRRYPVPSKITDAFDQCRDDIQLKLNDKNAKELEVEHVVVKKERSAALPDQNASQLSRTKQYIGDSATEGSLYVQIKLLEREIKIRKEQFGTTVFDDVLQNATQKSKVKGALQTMVGAGDEKKIEEIVRTSAREIGILRQQREGKKRELEAVDNGVL